MLSNPRITIVTPCFNSEKYIEFCIKSIMSQSYKNVEHIIIDGGSTDKTLDIIRKYEGKYNMRYLSETDNGMYDAITKGFNLATGDIYAWLNSDDMYMPWACEVVASVMSKTNIKWCTGIPTIYNKKGVQTLAFSRLVPVYPRKYIAMGYFDGRVAGFIQQESTFWTKELWDKCGHVV